MIKVLRNLEVYSPEPLGRCDILIANDKIALVEKHLKVPLAEVLDFTGKIAFPGLIDCHVHITGGGGEGGFASRTPELLFSDLVKGGITTVVGCLGTDGVTRSLENLYAKAKALEEEGVTSFLYTGSYRVPPVTFTGNLMKDLMLIDKVIGVGEIAISDHRSSQPTIEEIKRIAADARVGGMLSKKAGVVNLHVGDGPYGIEMLFEIVRTTEIPITQFLPTHMNRNEKLLEEGLRWVQMGGFVDLTTGDEDTRGDLAAAKILQKYVELGFENLVTMSSDGQGSLPKFNEKKEFIGFKVGRVTSLFAHLRTAIKNGVPIQKALKSVTVNPARALRLCGKGIIREGYDADILIVDSDLNVDAVVAKGKILMKDKNVLVTGTFEER